MPLSFTSAVECAPLLEGAPYGLASLMPAAVRSGARSDRPATLGAVSVEIASGADAVDALGEEWRGLSAASGHVSVFQSHAWVSAAARYHEARGADVRVALVRRDGRLEAALPVALERRAGVRIAKMLGDPVTQYGDALVARDAHPDAAALVLDGVRSLPVDVLHFRRVRADSALAPVLAGASGAVGRPIAAPFTDLTSGGTVDDLLREAGGAKQRRERARSRRRLMEQGPIALDVRRGRDAVAPMRKALAIKRAWLASRGMASSVLDDVDAIRMLERIAEDPHEGDACVAMTLTVGGEPAAYEVGHLAGGRFHAYLGAVLEKFAAASPGKVQMEETLGWCRANGVGIYDLLASGDDYKRQWTNGAVDVVDVVAPVTTVGRIYGDLWVRAAKPWLRAQVTRLPANIRRAAIKAALGVKE